MRSISIKVKAGKKRLSLMFILSMAFLFHLSFLPTVHAATAIELAAQIGAMPGITATVDDGDPNVVHVSGFASNATTTLALNIDPAVTVKWGAFYVSSEQMEVQLINLTGDGTFEVVSGAWVENRGNGISLNATGNNVKIVVSGGVLAANSGNAIYATGANAIVEVCGNGSVMTHSEYNVRPAIYMNNTSNVGLNVTVKDNGSVAIVSDVGSGYAIQTYGNVAVSDNAHIFVTGNGRAINALGAYSSVEVSGGKVWTGSGMTIHTNSATASVTVSGGLVYNEGTDDSHAAIDMGTTGGNVTVNGTGSVEGTGAGGTAIKTSGNVTVSENANVSATTGFAVHTTGSSSIVTVSDYANVSAAGVTTNAATIRADGAGATVTVNGGTVSATTRYAISTGNNAGATVTVSNGFVFAYGTGINSVIQNTSFTAPGGDGLVVAWDKPSTPPYTYVSRGQTDLNVFPASATTDLRWTAGGINYAHNTNIGFFPISDVTITSDRGLIFDVSQGKFFLDGNQNGILDVTDPEYIDGKDITWSFSGGILTLNDFRWQTSAQFALTILNGDLAIHLEDGSVNAFRSEDENGTLTLSCGISTMQDLAISGYGILYVSGGETTNGSRGIEVESLTVNGGTLIATGGLADNGVSHGIFSGSLIINSGAVEATGYDGAFNAAPTTLPEAYTYATNNTPVPSTEETLYYPGKTPFSYNAGNQYVSIKSERVAVIDNADITGTAGAEFTAPYLTATITLYGDRVANELTDTGVTDWFTDLPDGVIVTASAAADDNAIVLTFSGAPATASTTVFDITLPAGVLAAFEPLMVQPNANATLTANKASLLLTISDMSATYTGNPIHIAPALLTGAIGGATFSVDYSYETGGTPVSEALDAGIYTVTASVSGDANHQEASATATLTVEKATPAIMLTSVSVPYTGNPVPVNTPTVTGSTTAGNLLLNIVYEDENGISITNEPVNAGLYLAKVSTAGDANHYPANAVATINIGTESPYISLNDASKVYDGVPLSVKATVIPDNLTVTYSYEGTLKDGTPYALTDQAPTDAGDYTVTAFVAGDGNFDATEVTAAIEITPKQAIITMSNKSAPYTGDPIAIDDPATVDPAGATLTITYTGIAGTIYPENAAPPTDGGDYEVKAAYAGSNNYLPTQATAILTISDAGAPALSLDNHTTVYDGQPQGIGEATVSPQEAEYLEVTYTYTNANYPVSTTPPVNAGVYTVVATTPADNNFTEGRVTATLVIEKAPQTIDFDLPANKNLDESPFSANASVNSGLSLTYQSGNPTIATIDDAGLITLLEEGVVSFTVSQPGNENYLPASETRTMSITNNSSGTEFLIGITVNGESLVVSDNMEYVMPCGSGELATVELTVGAGATVDPGITFTVTVDQPQLKEVTFTVTQGTVSKTYTLTIERRFPFEQIVLMRWNNTLTVINNPANNGGYTFTSYQWYRNGQPFATGQSWSAGAGGELLSTTDVFYVEVTSNDFAGKLRTCESVVSLKSMSVIAYPNPVFTGQTLYVEADVDDELLENAVIDVYNVMGVRVERLVVQGRLTPVNVQYSEGIHFFVFRGKDGFSKEVKVIVK